MNSRKTTRWLIACASMLWIALVVLIPSISQSSAPPKTRTVNPAGSIVFSDGPIASGITTNIWIMDPDGANATQLTNLPGINFFPAISRDGSRIAFSAYDSSLWVMNSDGSNLHQLPMPGHTNCIEWSPDGTKLLVSNDSVDWWEIWTMNADGTGAVRLTTHTWPSSRPAWSPDGQKIAYIVANPGYYMDLWIVNQDGSNDHEVLSSSSGFSHHSPRWAPDGSRIATVRWIAGTSFDTAIRQLTVMNPDGTSEVPIVTNVDSPDYLSIFWTLNSQWLVFGKEGAAWKVERTGLNLAKIGTSSAWMPSTNAITFDGVQVVYVPVLMAPAQTATPTATPSPTPTATPPSIRGRVTYTGTPAANVSLDLRFYNGSSWSTAASTTTGADGKYSFLNVPSLGANQGYYVRYRNSSDASRLWSWSTRLLTSYTNGTDVAIGDFDVANIKLTAPPDQAAWSLPLLFTWIARPQSPSDSYVFTIYDAATGSPFAQTFPLGYVNQFTLNSLPPTFTYNHLYAWEIWACAPDGGCGISYEARRVTLLAGAAPSHAPDAYGGWASPPPATVPADIPQRIGR
ncbi:MAG: PD40 domain-containing protein [Chloroflexi bacterium]|nr:PD40 domain-containing protein [Chloroflexota bacterium]